MTRKKIEYVSCDRAGIEYSDFEKHGFYAIEARVSERYKAHLPANILHQVATSANASLVIALYLESAVHRDHPSYEHQLLMLHDFKQLLENKKEPRYFGSGKKYQNCYENICALLEERKNYEKTHVISAAFYKATPRIGKENFPVAHTEEFLEYTEIITREMIEAITNMVLNQIYRFFPSRGPSYYQALTIRDAQETVHDFASVDDLGDSAENEQETRRITFA